MSQHGFIYAIRLSGTPFVKIGMTTTSVEERMKALQTGQPFPLEIIEAVPVDGNVIAIERGVHLRMHKQRWNGEWFKDVFSDFSLADTVAQVLDDLCIDVTQRNEEAFKANKALYEADQYAWLDATVDALASAHASIYVDGIKKVFDEYFLLSFEEPCLQMKEIIADLFLWQNNPGLRCAIIRKSMTFSRKRIKNLPKYVLDMLCSDLALRQDHNAVFEAIEDAQVNISNVQSSYELHWGREFYIPDSFESMRIFTREEILDETFFPEESDVISSEPS